MSSLFYKKSSFNEDISAWDTSGVTDMGWMFYEASAFNRDIGGWAVHSVTDMAYMFRSARAFDQDLGGWAVHSVTDMRYMFKGAWSFNQDLGWCVDDDVKLNYASEYTPCESTSCGIGDRSLLRCGSRMGDTTIRTAVRAWLSDSAAAEARYGHISTWQTGGVKDMSWLFSANYLWGNSAASSFNEPIGGWDVRKVKSMSNMFTDARSFNQDISGWQVGKVEKMKRMFLRASSFDKNIGGWSIEAVTDMHHMFRYASAFDQDLGWCVGKDTDLDDAFEKAKCESTSCGVAQKDVIGLCEWLPVARPCLIGKGSHTECTVNSPTIIIAIVLIFLAVFGACVHRRKKKDETYAAAARRVLCGCICCCCCCFCCRKAEPSSVDSRPDSPAKSPLEDSDEEATGPESLETRAAAKAKAAETVELSSFSKKLTSFLFREQEEAPKEELATIAVAPEAEEEGLTEQPPPPPRRWFSRAEPEPESEPGPELGPEPEEMYNQTAAWYNEPENAAYPEPEQEQFLDREAG